MSCLPVLSSSYTYSQCYWYFLEGYLGIKQVNTGSTASLSSWTPHSMGRCTASWAVLRVCSHCISFEASEARNRQCSNGILSCVWAALPCLTVRSEFGDPAALHRTDLICIKLRSSCDSANLHTVTGPSAHRAVFIVHRVAGSHVKMNESHRLDIRCQIWCASTITVFRGTCRYQVHIRLICTYEGGLILI